MKDSFIFYRDWRDGMCELPTSLKVELYDAIISYALDGEEIELSTEAAMVFSFIKPKLMRDSQKYKERCERNKSNGKKGGRPTKNPENPVGYLKTQKNQQNPVGGDNDNDNDNDIQDTNVSMSIFKSSYTEDSLHSDAVATQPKTFREKIVAFFNAKMEGKSIKPIRSIKDGTKRAEWLKARRREYGDDAIMEMIEKASMSKFLNGYNTRGFVASFDWMMRPNNFPKVLEGNYDDRTITETTVQQTDWQS